MPKALVEIKNDTAVATTNSTSVRIPKISEMMKWDKAPMTDEEIAADNASGNALLKIKNETTTLNSTTNSTIPKISDMMKFDKGPLIVPDNSIA